MMTKCFGIAAVAQKPSCTVQLYLMFCCGNSLCRNAFRQVRWRLQKAGKSMGGGMAKGRSMQVARLEAKEFVHHVGHSRAT